MNIDKKLISRLEHLARLELSEEETEELMGDLNDILAMVEKLQELDTTNVSPLAYINEGRHQMRKDHIQGQVSREEALRNAPEHDDGHFRVPKVIDL